MEQGDGHQLQGSRGNTISPLILRRVSTKRSERQSQMPKDRGHLDSLFAFLLIILVDFIFQALKICFVSEIKS